MNKKLLIIVLFLLCGQVFFSVRAQEKTLHFISNSHLDTQWNWDVKTTIDQYILNTMTQNFPLFDKYSAFQFNFEAAIHYMWMKEYYPEEYVKVKKYIQDGRWNISGGSINANEVMVSSAESIIRNFLYGQTYYKQEFGQKGGNDIMLPDCFGFPYSLPTLGKHCGVTGFHTQKLSWGSAYDYNSLAPFGIWRGVDGSEIFAVFKGEAYDWHEVYNKDMSKDQDMLNIINANESKYGVPAVFRYVGPRGDRGGGLKDSSNEAGENTPYWLDYSVKSNGPVKVKMSTPDEIFTLLEQYKNDKYFVWDNELPMSTHGAGCYTSQAIMKYWNRKNELLADATEKSSVLADWIGGADYPAAALKESWIKLLWHQFHDDLTGTSIPNAYGFSYNDEVLVNLDLSKTLLSSVGAIAKKMNTQVNGIPFVVYNPLSIQRTDVVEASAIVPSVPAAIRVLDGQGNEVLSQITSYDAKTKKLSFLFEATVSSLGYAAYELCLNEESALKSDVKIEEKKIENDLYTISLNNNGDVASIYDKKQNVDLLLSPIRLAMFNDRSESFPSWEIKWNDVNASPAAYVDENVTVSIAEKGPLRVSLKITRSKNNSEFVQYIRLTPARISERIDFVNEVNWQTRGTMLKAIFPLRAGNSKATYDLSIGAIERGVNTSNLYEVAGHQWADQSHTNGTYGVSILNDCKYGWDKPNNNMLRLTLIHTPAVNKDYAYQKDQDLGLNKFTYSFYRHLGTWDENTQWEASRLNQPLFAFQAPKHEGALGKSVDFISVNTDKVAIKALKKAEESDEIIVRVYELTGKDQNNVKISFPANVVSAREVNGIEEPVGAAQYSGKQLSFNIGRFQPKTFAVKLSAVEITNEAQTPSSLIVDLSYNVDVMSFDSKKNDATSGVKYAYPAELFTTDTIDSDGIKFKIGSRKASARNAVYCNGQNITLPAMQNAGKLYILAGSKNEEGNTVEFLLDGVAHSFDIPYYAGSVGAWETEYNLGSEFRKENVAFAATHRHNVSDNKNESYNFMYMYKYCIPFTGLPQQLTLPTNRNVYVFAVTISDNENDDIISATEIVSLPEYTDLNAYVGGCSEWLTPKTARASHQNGSNEGAEKAIDKNTGTKWCVTNNSTPWLELTFEEPVEICHWLLLNAGNEGFNSITKDFRLQYYSSGQWVDADVVKNNTINKVNRSVTPFTAEKVRLQIDKGEQDGNTTRILEFAVFGEDKTPPSLVENPQKDAGGFQIIGNFPNPVKDKTTIQCVTSGYIDQLTLEVYSLSGTLIDTKSYQVTVNQNTCRIDWDSNAVNGGIYLYRVSAFSGDKFISSAVSRMIIKNE